MSTVTPFETRSNYTRIHNYVLDHIMPRLTANEWKVLCFVIRKTKGWGKDTEQLSYSDIKTGTGIKSATTLSTVLKSLQLSKYIITESGGSQWEATSYSLNTTLEIELDTTPENGVEPSPKNGVDTSPKNGLVSTPKNGEYIKEKKERKEERENIDQSYANNAAEFGSKKAPYFSDSDGEYMPGLKLPAQRKEQRIAGEKMRMATLQGLRADEFQILVTHILDKHGTLAIAMSGTDNGDRYFYRAQDTIIELAALGFKTQSAIDSVYASWAANDYRGDSMPTTAQLTEHAALMQRGAVTCQRRDKAQTSTPPGEWLVSQHVKDL